MKASRSPLHVMRRVGVVLLFACAGMAPAFAGAPAPDDTAEREALGALARELDLLDRLAEHAAATSPQERARVHFDYARLREDVRRVRAGIQDYLVPQRAQPRDSLPLAGDYTRSRGQDKQGEQDAPSP